MKDYRRLARQMMEQARARAASQRRRGGHSINLSQRVNRAAVTNVNSDGAIHGVTARQSFKITQDV